MAIAYAQDNAWKSLSKGCIDFVVKKVDAKKKMAFIHCDYSNFGGYNKKQEIMLSRLDYINCVSESCKKSFIDKFPTLQSKCIVIENFIDYKKVVELSNEYETEFANDDYFVSACRLSSVKGLDRTIGVLGELNKERAINCKWVIVGDGPEKENLEVSIDECGLKNIVFLIGEKENPYPYIKKARAFLLPSYHEAAPMVYGESAALGVPIVSTDTCSAAELVKDRNIGIVVDNNEAGIKRGLNEIIDGTVESNRIGVEEINKIAESQLKNLYIELCKT
ncbi:MAG: glycosyltransferase [Eubacteriales bacterium]|nr:glycosyltransferase [Eubacteriales bacterium]